MNEVMSYVGTVGKCTALREKEIPLVTATGRPEGTMGDELNRTGR